MCEECEVTSLDQGHDFKHVIVPQSDETADILKQSNGETSADWTALEKNRLDRKTNHQALRRPRHSQGRRGRNVGETSMRRLNTVASQR